MTDRRLSIKPDAAPSDAPAPLRHRHSPSDGIADRVAHRPHSREEAETRYVAAREAWAATMRKASSGRSADLAALAMAQETYEAALAERERWASSPQIAIPVQPDPSLSINVVVGQELSWRRVHQHEPQPKGLGRLIRRITGR